MVVRRNGRSVLSASVMGPDNVGKQRFIDVAAGIGFTSRHPSSNPIFETLKCYINEEKINGILWNINPWFNYITSRERIRQLLTTTKGCLVLIDIANPSTMDKVMEVVAHAFSVVDLTTPISIVGTSKDLKINDKVKRRDALDLSQALTYLISTYIPFRAASLKQKSECNPIVIELFHNIIKTSNHTTIEKQNVVERYHKTEDTYLKSLIIKQLDDRHISFLQQIIIETEDKLLTILATKQLYATNQEALFEISDMMSGDYTSILDIMKMEDLRKIQYLEDSNPGQLEKTVIIDTLSDEDYLKKITRSHLNSLFKLQAYRRLMTITKLKVEDITEMYETSNEKGLFINYLENEIVLRNIVFDESEPLRRRVLAIKNIETKKILLELRLQLDDQRLSNLVLHKLHENKDENNLD